MARELRLLLVDRGVDELAAAVRAEVVAGAVFAALSVWTEAPPPHDLRRLGVLTAAALEQVRPALADESKATASVTCSHTAIEAAIWASVSRVACSTSRPGRRGRGGSSRPVTITTAAASVRGSPGRWSAKALIRSLR